MKIIKYLDKLSSLKDKTVLVSGSNAGIGFSIAKHILYKGGHLVMLCRSKERMNQAREKLLSIYEYAKIDKADIIAPIIIVSIICLIVVFGFAIYKNKKEKR